VMQDVYHKKFQEQSELNKELDTQIQEQAQNFTRLFVALDGRVAENAKKFADKADVKDLTKKSTQFAAQFERLDQHCADVTARLTKIESQTAEFKRFQSEQSAEEDARLDALESRVTELTRVTAETPGAFSDFVHKLKEVKDTSESMQRTTTESLDNIVKRQLDATAVTSTILAKVDALQTTNNEEFLNHHHRLNVIENKLKDRFPSELPSAEEFTTLRTQIVDIRSTAISAQRLAQQTQKLVSSTLPASASVAAATTAPLVDTAADAAAATAAAAAAAAAAVAAAASPAPTVPPPVVAPPPVTAPVVAIPPSRKSSLENNLLFTTKQSTTLDPRCWSPTNPLDVKEAIRSHNVMSVKNNPNIATLLSDENHRYQTTKRQLSIPNLQKLS